jgi:hypothetical protein
MIKAISENRIKLKRCDNVYVYYENHHIVPKCLNGSNEKDNMILLTAKEHYVCHKLLTYIYPLNYKIISAFHYMSINKHYKCMSLRDYELAKFLKANTRMSGETIQKMSTSAKSRPKISDETRLKLRNMVVWNKGKKGIQCVSENTKMMIRSKLINVPKSEEAKVNMKGNNKGHVMSDVQKNKLRIANLGKTSP